VVSSKKRLDLMRGRIKKEGNVNAENSGNFRQGKRKSRKNWVIGKKSGDRKRRASGNSRKAAMGTEAPVSTGVTRRDAKNVQNQKGPSLTGIGGKDIVLGGDGVEGAREQKVAEEIGPLLTSPPAQQRKGGKICGACKIARNQPP